MENIIRCKVRPQKKLAGKHFGRLLVLSPVGLQCQKIVWECLCDCGNTTLVTTGRLINGNTKSCGCLRKELLVQRSRSHGKSKTRIYYVWRDIVKRTSNSKHPGYACYGGRGINICESWKIFENFYKDMGDAPFEKAEIDRTDNSKGYSKANCRWVTSKENCRNTRTNRLITIGSETYCLSEWAERSGINVKTVRSRLKLGWDIETALKKPVKLTGRGVYKDFD